VIIKPITSDAKENIDLQILSGGFLQAYGKDIINIHHGLLPSFKGGHPSRQVLI
jgi:formyltetrahydrofolate hydrolase